MSEVPEPEFDGLKFAIGQEIYKAMQRLGAQSPLLATVGSYGDTLPDEEVLRQLRAHNVKAGIHYECPCCLEEVAVKWVPVEGATHMKDLCCAICGSRDLRALNAHAEGK
jgi:hypothetical protein